MSFRSWCYNMWMDHCDEVYAWSGERVKYFSAEYFNKYKWWLRREFRAVAKKQQRPGS
jgi:ssDNA-binding replication factor A large subunit